MVACAEHPRSYYAASANPASNHPRLEGEVSCDVCVVGAGFTGLSAALHLAERGYDVVVLEGARVGWGASGRNGGQIVSGFAPQMDAIRSVVGEEDARALWAMAEEAKAIIKDRVARHRIRCDLKRGYLYVAKKKRQIAALAAMAEEWTRDYGYEGGRLIGRAELREMVATDAYHGGCFDPGGGQLHPLNYCLGLAEAAKAKGVRIFEGSRVERLEPGPRPVAHTARGPVRADALALCGNAYLGPLAPRIWSKVVPVGSYVGATEPLGEARAHDLIPADVAVSDCNFVLDYYRLSADHRLLFGGGVSYSTLPPPDLAASLRRAMLKIFPQLRGVRMEYAWSGLLGITLTRMPHLGRLGRNAYFAQGFSGHGVALSGLAGKLIAEAIAGDAERFDVFARFPHRSFPGGRFLRTPLLVLGTLYYRLRDLL